MKKTKTKKTKKIEETKKATRKPEEKKKSIVPPTSMTRDAKWAIRKFIPATAAVLGIGYILSNIAVVIILSRTLSQLTLSSLSTINYISGLILFVMASIVMMVVGAALIGGGTRYYKKNPPPREIMFLTVLFAAFYLLCLGTGSALLLSEINLSVGLLIVSPIFIMVSAAVYMVPSFASKLVGHVLGIVGGFLLAIVIFNFQILKVALGWDIPFPGPFMSMAVMEGIAVILGSIAVAVHSIFAGRNEKPVSYVFFSIVGLVYGIGVFIGPMILSFSFLDLVWKAPWGVGPLSALPNWIRDTTVFWSASLILLEIGGLLLILSSCLGFTFAAREFSRLYAPLSEEKRRIAKKERKKVAKSKIATSRSH